MSAIVIIRYQIEAKAKQDFLAWKAEMNDRLAGCEGFIDMADLGMVNGKDFYYVLLYFESERHARAWLTSDYRRMMLRRAAGKWISNNEEIVKGWHEFWFASFGTAKRWKQWLVTLITIYPLTLIVPLLTGFKTALMPYPLLTGLLHSVILSAIMVFAAMPFMLKMFRKWLHT